MKGEMMVAGADGNERDWKKREHNNECNNNNNNNNGENYSYHLHEVNNNVNDRNNHRKQWGAGQIHQSLDSLLTDIEL